MKTKFISFYSEPNLEGISKGDHPVINRFTNDPRLISPQGIELYYTECAKNLKKKFDEFGLRYDIRELPERENHYMLNCLKKPGFILDMLNELDEPLIWIDVDSIMQRPPALMDDCTTDCGFVIREHVTNTPYCGLLYFDNTPATKKFLEDWKQRCEEHIEDTKRGDYIGGDHHLLILALKENKHNITLSGFPHTVAELYYRYPDADVIFGLSGWEEKLKDEQKEAYTKTNKIQVFYPPFSLEDRSSCAKMKPSRFHWVSSNQDVQVFIDNGMLMSHIHPRKPGTHRFGWLCESRSILPELYHKLKTQHLEFFNNFDAIFTCDEDLLSLDDRFIKALSGSNLPWTPYENFGVHEKTKVCSLLASPKLMTEGHKLRHKLAEELKDNIDVFGGVGGSPKIGDGTHASKSEALKDYMFSITIENDSYNNYYTEKITDCFANGTIPVYWGAPNIGEYFDDEGIIILNDNFDINLLTKELYESKIESVKRNLDILSSGLDMADDIIWDKTQSYILNRSLQSPIESIKS